MSEAGGRGPLDFDIDEEQDARDRARAAQAPPTAPAPPPAPAPGNRGPQSPGILGGSSRYVVIVAGLFMLIVGYVAVRGHSNGVSARGLKAGSTLPPFAAPLAVGPLNGDVNVAEHANAGQAGRVPACRRRGAAILNICQLYERGPVVLAFAVTGGARCVRQLDVIDRVRRRHPGVQFAAVALRGNRETVRRVVRAHRWGFPVGYDHDGALAPLYGVVVCPLTTFAFPGGRVLGTAIGEMTPAALDRQVRALEAASRRRGWSPP
jgi:hypothetical protein